MTEDKQKNASELDAVLPPFDSFRTPAEEDVAIGGWAGATEHMFDAVLDDAEHYAEGTGTLPQAACAFVLHEDGALSVAGVGPGRAADLMLLLARHCGAFRRALLEEALRGAAEDLKDFAGAVKEVLDGEL